MEEPFINEQALETAIKYAVLRSRTVGETRKKLTDCGYSEDEINSVISRLHEIFLLDDAEYAKRFIVSKLNQRTCSRCYLVVKLREKLIDEFTIEDALAEVGFSDEAELENAFIEAQKTVTAETDFKQKQKIIRRLVSHGYKYETAREATERACKQYGA